MRVAVAFQDERVELDVPDGRLVGAWEGPEGARASDVPGMVARALEEPQGFPPLRHAVVPGDRVVVALGADVPEARSVVGQICRVLGESGVAPGDITVLADVPPDKEDDLAGDMPPGVVFRRHDPGARTQIAYLATTTQGRRVYLNRLLTDSDIVVPVGRLAYDSVLGYRGPWGVIFPGLSDSETLQAYRARATVLRPDRDAPPEALNESNEVGWLLGCQFQVGVVAGVRGVTDVVSGLGSTVFEQGTLAVDRGWSFLASGRAELVVVGIGRPGENVGMTDVARGLAAAQRLVQRGGKIMALSRAGGVLGPSMSRLAATQDPRAAASVLKGHEADFDHAAAVQLAKALDWADVYLLSALEPGVVEDLSMIALERPEEVRRLAAASHSCLVVSQADLVRAGVADEPD
jgi:nickel-dependent lactate racemase